MRIASAPPNYLRTLPATIASDAINHGLQRQPRDQHTLFVERTAPWTVRAITSPRYARVHHDELAARVAALIADPALRTRMGEAGRARVEKDFTSRPVREFETLLLSHIRR